MRALPRRLVAVAVATTAAVAAAPTPVQAHTHRGTAYVKVGYFSQWGIYGRNFPLAKVEQSGAAARLTHLNYAFGTVTADGHCASADTWADWGKLFDAAQSVDGVADSADLPFAGNMQQILELKREHPKLKAMISLGGWSLSKYFSDAVLTDASRKRLVTSCVDLWIKGNLPGLPAGVAAGVFDGIDLDWEWPGSSGNDGNVIRPEDKQNFTALAKEFREQLDRLSRTTGSRYELTAYLPAAPAKIDAGFEVKKIFKYLDFGNVQGYDLHVPAERTTNHQSALFRPRNSPVRPDFTVDGAIDAWIARGAPKRSLALGLPYYSQGWTGVTGGGDGLFQPSTGAASGVFAVGTEDYKTVKRLPGFTVHRDLKAGHAWVYDGTTFWTYDDATQMRQKTAYIRAKGLRGAMMWSLDGDDTATLTRAVSQGLRSR